MWRFLPQCGDYESVTRSRPTTWIHLDPLSLQQPGDLPLVQRCQTKRFSWRYQRSVDCYTVTNVANYTTQRWYTGIHLSWCWLGDLTTRHSTGGRHVTVNGTETYSYQQAHTTPAVANGYW